MHRPTLLPTPLAPLKLLYGGELVQQMLVEGQRVLPAVLEATGYEFGHRTIDEAFAAVPSERSERGGPTVSRAVPAPAPAAGAAVDVASAR